jgi:hypothetical protein
MKALELLKRAVHSDESDGGLNLTGVYQDSVTRSWAMQMCRRATRLAGAAGAQNQWFDANALGHPGTFLTAVQAAMTADVIVVSVYAAEELPLDLYVWFEAWLPRRLPRVGALTALIGVEESMDSQTVRTLEYLQAVARKAKLDFVPRKRKRPGAFPTAALKATQAEANAAKQGLCELYGRQSDNYCHWGLNE